MISLCSLLLFVMSGLVGIVSEVYQGDSVETVFGPAANKIEREINLAKEILESEILVAQPPRQPEKCVLQRTERKKPVDKKQIQKGGAKLTTKRVAPKKTPTKPPSKKKVKKNGGR